MKIRRFFKKHYKKLVVPLICVLLSFSLVLVASAETFTYNLWQQYNSSQYLVYYETGSGLISTRISNHNPSVKDAILGTSVPNITAENGLKSFYLRVDLTKDSGPMLYPGSKLYLTGDLVSNFSFCGADGKPCFLTLKKVYINFGSLGLSSTSCGTNEPISGTEIATYSYYANFDQFLNNARISYYRFEFELDRPAYQSQWATHELQYSCSLASGVNLQVTYDKATSPIYTPPDSGTLDTALGLESDLMDVVGGDLDRLDGLFDTSNIDNDTIYKPISAFTAVFNSLFNNQSAFSNFIQRVLTFSVAVGLSGFVLNVVVSIASKSNDKKGGKGG